jgi:hypothetical protein
MKRATLLLSAALLLASTGPQVLPGQSTPELPETIVIQVSPHTLNLDWRSRGDPEVTVHADVPFILFAGGSLDIWLGGVQADFISSDARGDLVAKFPFDLVIQHLGPGSATLTLQACDLDGYCYIGSDEVRVIAP